jgi:hypothetical protein
LAVIKDSFREAWASRVLWIVLALITLFLLALVPLSWTRQLTVGLRRDDVRDSDQLLQQLKKGLVTTSPSPVQYIASRLAEEMKSRLSASNPSEEGRASQDVRLQRDVISAVDEVIRQRDFFRADVWPPESLGTEAQELIGRGVDQLSDNEVQRLNRLALEAAFPQQIRQRPSQSVLFRYLVWDIAEPVRLREEQLNRTIRGFVAAFISIVAGMFGVFAGILVTASIIPNMFDSGSISLLLSKPISRPLLFLAKFFGGCWFVLINAAYLIAGLWLLLGLRFDIWYRNLLLCIPVFLFLFIVYYSVSAAAGLVWRNTVVCIAMTVLFWFICVMVGTAKQMVEMFFVHPQRLVRLLPIDDTLLAVNEQGRVEEWTNQPAGWKYVFASDQPSAGPPIMIGPQMSGPVYDSQGDRLVAIVPAWPEARLFAGRRAEDWEREEVGAAPRVTRELLVEPDGRVLAVTSEGLLRLASETQQPINKLEIFGYRIPLLQGQKPFRPAGGDSTIQFGESKSATLNGDSGMLYVLQGSRLTSLSPDSDGLYQKHTQVEATEPEQNAVLAACGDTLLVACADGQLILRDAQDLTLKNSFEPPCKSQPRFAVASPNGKMIAVLFHNRNLWLLDVPTQSPAKISIAGQGDISAVGFARADRLLIADAVDRVTVYELPSGRVDRRYTPPKDTVRRVYSYLLSPLYTIFPKPGELDNSVNYLMTEQDTVAIGGDQDDLRAAQFRIDPWGPVWSSLAFVVVVLVLSCVYIQRQDF